MDRHKLHFGPYHTPPFRYGRKVDREYRGEVRIVGISAARIPWPVGLRKQGNGSPVLYGSLVRAVKREAACAVAHWWGVSPWLVNKWRRALGVPKHNEGSTRLQSAISKANKQAIAAMHAKARDPIRCAKIAAAKRGKPRPAHVIAAIRKANIGRKLSLEHRRKMSAAQKRRGTRPPAAGKPWEAWEVELCLTLPSAEVAKRTGRKLSAVCSRRYLLGVPDGRRVRP